MNTPTLPSTNRDSGLWKAVVVHAPLDQYPIRNTLARFAEGFFDSEDKAVNAVVKWAIEQTIGLPWFSCPEDYKPAVEAASDSPNPLLTAARATITEYLDDIELGTSRDIDTSHCKGEFPAIVERILLDHSDTMTLDEKREFIDYVLGTVEDDQTEVGFSIQPITIQNSLL